MPVFEFRASLKVFGFALYGPQAASHRVRLSQFQMGLSTYGIELQIQSLLDDAYVHRRFAGGRLLLWGLFAAYIRRLQVLRCSDRFDLAIVYAELLPLLPAWLEQRLLTVPYILDLDDAFYLKYRSGRLGLLRPFLGSKIDRLIAGAAAVTVGSHILEQYARRFNPSVVFLPSVVDTNHYKPVERSTPGPLSDSFTVGWIGSPSTAPYLQSLVEPLSQLALERPVRLLVVGGPAPLIPGVEVIEQPWSLETEIPLIQSFDVGVMPLPDSPWARGKCAYKLIQCMACAVPVVASPVGANVDAVPTACGILASSPEQWLAAFRRMAADPDLRQRMGVSGRRWVKERYSLHSALPILAGAILQVAESRR